MGQNEFLNAQVVAIMDPRMDYRDDSEVGIHRVPGVPESARYGWESAWIDLGGEG